MKDTRTSPSGAHIAFFYRAVCGGRLGAAVTAAAVAMMIAAGPVVSTPAAARSAPESFADLAEKLLPSVVNISTTQASKKGGSAMELPQFPPGSPFEDLFRDFFDRNRPDSAPRKVTSLGSGFIIDASGYVVTNYHVIEDAEEITVILHDDTNLKARIIGRDKSTDLALLKVESEKPLPAVDWGDSDAVRVGDWVVAIGNPFGLGGTVTTGILSARKRTIDSGESSAYVSYLQTDASINRGNSGGPMFDMDGRVIGVNTAIYSPSGGSIGIGFAIPSNQASQIVHQLREYGRTRRGWIGTRIQTVTKEIAESLQLDKPRGALIAGVTEDGPAEQAGLKSGDVILTFDGKPVPEMRDLPRIVSGTPIEEAVPVEIWRNGKKETIRVKVGEVPEDLEERKVSGIEDKDAVQMLGMSMAELSDGLRERYKLDSRAKGVVVLDVKEGSSAKKAGLQEGDLIVEVAPDTVTSPKEFEERIDDAREAKRKTVLLLTERKKVRQFVVLPIQG